MTEENFKITSGMTVEQVQNSAQASDWQKKNISIFDRNGNNILEDNEISYLNCVEDLETKLNNNDAKLYDTMYDLINNTPDNELAQIMYVHEAVSGTNILLVLDNLSKQDTKYSELINTLKNGKNNFYIKNKIIAFDNRKSLNSGNIEQINDAIKQINSQNVKDVYINYLYMAKSNGDSSIAPDVISLLAKFFHGASLRQIRGGTRTETLLQGIINNTELNLEQKREYLGNIVSKFIDNAKDNTKYPQDKINNLIHRKDELINDALQNKNSFNLEKVIGQIYGW